MQFDLRLSLKLKKSYTERDGAVTILIVFEVKNIKRNKTRIHTSLDVGTRNVLTHRIITTNQIV